MKPVLLCVLALLALTACQQEPMLQAEHFPLYDECTLLHEHNLYTDMDCTQYAIQATTNEELILDELCEFKQYGCTDFQTSIGFIDIEVRVYLNTLPEQATIAFTAINRTCTIGEDHISCKVPFVARDLQYKQPFIFTLDNQTTALLLAYV
ncbi:MAG: hypothetical protein ACMXYD_04835 [Candidatus Woesearchaeota archaeon]